MKFFLFIFLLACNLLLCQTIPNEFKEFHKRKLLIDSGKNWDQNSIFGPPRLINSKSKTDSLIINSRFGFQVFNKAKALYGYGHFTYKNNFMSSKLQLSSKCSASNDMTTPNNIRGITSKNYSAQYISLIKLNASTASLPT